MEKELKTILGIPYTWTDLKPFVIFLLGIISSYPPYDTMTPDEIFDDLSKRFMQAETNSKLE